MEPSPGQSFLKVYFYYEIAIEIDYLTEFDYLTVFDYLINLFNEIEHFYMLGQYFKCTLLLLTYRLFNFTHALFALKIAR